MVSKLKNNGGIQRRLYEDPVSYVEEISLIEENYLWQNVTIYVDEPSSMQQFLIIHSPSFYLGGRSISAYMTAENLATITEFAEILERKKDFQTHLETSARPSHIRRLMPWLAKTYTVRYCQANSKSFKPQCEHRTRAVKLTPKTSSSCNPQLHLSLSSDLRPRPYTVM